MRDDAGSPNRILLASPERGTHTDLDALGEWLIRRDDTHVPSTPHEVEIELTTADAYPNTLARPRGERVPSRGPIDPSLVGRVAQELSAFDDSLVVLGGFGDPLRHPALAEVLTRLRPAGNDGAGIYGVAVRTSAADLDEEKMSAIVSSGVDVLDVTLDAWTPELYARLHDPPGDETSRSPESARPDLALVLANLEKLAAVQREHGAARPIVVPGMTKMRENVCELDDFFDGWLRKKGAVSVSGYSHHAGQCDDRAVIGMAPAARSPCRRIRERCLILADGRVVMCDQDFKGVHALESLHERSLQEIWQGPAFEALRAGHRQGKYDAHPLCAACDEWHRP